MKNTDSSWSDLLSTLAAVAIQAVCLMIVWNFLSFKPINFWIALCMIIVFRMIVNAITIIVRSI